MDEHAEEMRVLKLLRLRDRYGISFPVSKVLNSALLYVDGPDCHSVSQEISVNGSAWWGESSTLQGKQ